jgi:class 3 adenylate cyclase
VKDLVEVRPVSPLRLKGKANPVQVYELLGLQNSTR